MSSSSSSSLSSPITVPESNIAAVLHGIMDLRVETIPTPTLLQPNDVLVKMANVGICGSDVHYLVHGSIGPFVVKDPMIIGHESSGTVLQVGTNVKHLQTGDNVALEPGVPCNEAQCSSCHTGQYNLCPKMQFFATPPIHGSLARYITHPAAFCFKLPSNVSLEEGALCEPLAVGVHACRRGEVKAGDQVLVLGAGPIGLICAQVARASGATNVIITDINQARLEFAKQHGFVDNFINVKGFSPEQVSEQIKNLCNGQGVNVVIECCGFTSALATGIGAVRPGGNIVLVGMGSNEVTLPLLEASIREVDLRPVFRYRHCYGAAVELIATGKVNVKPLITHRFPGLDQDSVVKGFMMAKEGKDNAIKIMFSL